MNTTVSDPEDVHGKSRRVLQGKSTDRATLAAIARQAMIERGLEPDFPPAAQQELAAISGPAGATADVRDLRDRLWVSIDNDDSRDLDQLTVAESLADGRVRILVAVADVDALVLSGRTGESFDAIVTGASPKGTWVRLFQPPAEGRLERGFQGLDVGHHVRVKLVHTDVQRGFIDFARD